MFSFFTECCSKQNEEIPLPCEQDGSLVPYSHAPFKNWGKTVEIKPHAIFYPKTKRGIQEIVKYSNRLNVPVRVSGFRHSWNNVFGQNNGIMISILSERESGLAGVIPTNHPPIDNSDELRSLHLIGSEFSENGKTKRLVKLGPAITNGQLRRWALSRDKENLPAYCLEASVVMEENTISGMISNMCHGAGIQHKTVADNVVAIEVVNAKGELQFIDDPEILRSAGGGLGLFGIITSVIIKMERMPYAVLKPQKTPLFLAVPPPPEYKLPQCIPNELRQNLTPEALSQARESLKKSMLTSDYFEYFWFPYQEDAWINCWNEDGKRENAVVFPSETGRCIQETEEYSAAITTPVLFQLLSGKNQAKFLADFAMLTLPTTSLTVAKPNAMHFRGGVNEFIVQDVEAEIEIPLDRNGELDVDVVLRAWTDAIVTFYEFNAKGETPMRMPLEMRVMNGSNMTMATQRGNQATLAIEFLTTEDANGKAFFQALVDKWSSYTNYEGKPLKFALHFAKQSAGLTIKRPCDEKRRTAAEYYRDVVFAPVRDIFIAHAKIVAAAGNCTVEEMFNKFSNEYLDITVLNRKPHKALNAAPIAAIKIPVIEGAGAAALPETKASSISGLSATIADEPAAIAHLERLHTAARSGMDHYFANLTPDSKTHSEIEGVRFWHDTPNVARI